MTEPSTDDPPDVDWPVLRAAATTAAANAYAPYSKLHVGAAALTESGDIITGVNVENASYGLTFCAEVSLMGAVVTGGHTPVVALAVVDGDGSPLTPCGRCRQVLIELAGPDVPVNESWTVGDLLPDAFLPQDLPD